MKKQIAIAIAAAALMFAAAGQADVHRRHHRQHVRQADHKAMNMGADAKCVTACVKAGAKYVLYDGKEAYTLSDQKTPEKFAAKKVTVTGTLDAKTKTIQVDSIAAAK